MLGIELGLYTYWATLHCWNVFTLSCGLVSRLWAWKEESIVIWVSWRVEYAWVLLEVGFIVPPCGTTVHILVRGWLWLESEFLPVVVAHTFNFNTWEAERQIDLHVWGQFGLHSEFHPGQPGPHKETLTKTTLQNKNKTKNLSFRLIFFCHVNLSFCNQCTRETLWKGEKGTAKQTYKEHAC